jgi:hypothetical protein
LGVFSGTAVRVDSARIVNAEAIGVEAAFEAVTVIVFAVEAGVRGFGRTAVSVATGVCESEAVRVEAAFKAVCVVVFAVEAGVDRFGVTGSFYAEAIGVEAVDQAVCVVVFTVRTQSGFFSRAVCGVAEAFVVFAVDSAVAVIINAVAAGLTTASVYNAKTVVVFAVSIAVAVVVFGVIANFFAGVSEAIWVRAVGEAVAIVVGAIVTDFDAFDVAAVVVAVYEAVSVVVFAVVTNFEAVAHDVCTVHISVVVVVNTVPANLTFSAGHREQHRSKEQSFTHPQILLSGPTLQGLTLDVPRFRYISLVTLAGPACRIL